jgi:4-diphosphocytidyl-2-C-methyl-D-erythritol kinase
MKIKAPAKINISLRVIKNRHGRVAARDDGFHEIVSLMQPLTLADLLTVEVEDGAGITITCDDPAVPTGASNLAHKATCLFLDAASLARKVNIHIEKHIPVAAGLGGGSSDGAATLLALNELMGSLLGKAQLHAIATELGSDVPFFLLQGAAIATGRGERLVPVNLPEYSYILINPGFAISAQWGYSNLILTETPLNIKLTDLGESTQALLESPIKVREMLFNDLQPAALARHPELTDILAAFKESGAEGALMSGSGPTVFGLFLQETEARVALSFLKESFKGRPYRVIFCKGTR